MTADDVLVQVKNLILVLQSLTLVTKPVLPETNRPSRYHLAIKVLPCKDKRDSDQLETVLPLIRALIWFCILLSSGSFVVHPNVPATSAAGREKL